MIKFMEFLKKLGLLRISIGFIIGVITAGVPGAIIYKNETKHYEARQIEQEKKLAIESAITNMQAEEIKRLRTKTVERINADGSSEKITEVNSDSSKLDSAVNQKFTQTEIDRMRETSVSEKTETTIKRQGKGKLQVVVGMTSNLQRYYKIGYKPFSRVLIEAGYTEPSALSDKSFYSAGVGLELF